MGRQTAWVVAGLVGVIASLATLLAVDLAGGRRAYAQDTSQTGYIAVVAGPTVRSRTIPLIIVDMQAMSIMTYDYTLSGNFASLKLTCARSFKYDRKLIDYNHRNHSKPETPLKKVKDGNTVQEIMEAVAKQRSLD